MIGDALVLVERLVSVRAGEDRRNRGWRAKLVVLAATGAGLGFLPFMPGTFGTIGAIPVVLIMSKLDPILYALDNRYYRVGSPIGTGYAEGRDPSIADCPGSCSMLD